MAIESVPESPSRITRESILKRAGVSQFINRLNAQIKDHEEQTGEVISNPEHPKYERALLEGFLLHGLAAKYSGILSSFALDSRKFKGARALSRKNQVHQQNKFLSADAVYSSFSSKLRSQRTGVVGHLIFENNVKSGALHSIDERLQAINVDESLRKDMIRELSSNALFLPR